MKILCKMCKIGLHKIGLHKWRYSKQYTGYRSCARCGIERYRVRINGGRLRWSEYME